MSQMTVDKNKGVAMKIDYTGQIIDQRITKF